MGVRIQLSPIIPESKGICKNIFRMLVFPLNFIFQWIKNIFKIVF